MKLSVHIYAKGESAQSHAYHLGLTINRKPALSLHRKCRIYNSISYTFHFPHFPPSTEFEARTAELIPKQGERRAKVVFLLTLNGRALRQVKRLIRVLYSTSHYFYIHVDAVRI